MSDKDLFAFLSLVVSIVGYAPYVVSIFNGTTKPHAFTWMTWTIGVTLAFAAQLNRGAGQGAWVTGCTVVGCAGIALLSLRYGDKDITRSDEIVFGATLAAIPVWVVTREPLWSVVMMVAINNLGFIPTFRKTWHDPYSENLPFYASVVAKFLLGIAALDRYALVTVLFPLNCVIANAVFLAMVIGRRRALAGAQGHAPWLQRRPPYAAPQPALTE